MMISTYHEFCFICTPKTASTALENALRRHSDIQIDGWDLPDIRHATYRDYEQYFQPFLTQKCPDKKIVSFCLVREPLDWLASWYKFRTRDALKGTLRFTGDMSFETFLDKLEQCENQGPFAVGTQHQFIVDQSGSIGVDRIFRYDDLAAAIRFVEDRIGTELNLQRHNVSPDIRVELGDNSAERVATLLARDDKLYRSLAPLE